jgi:5'-methylthioadenosine phosphorylase
MCFVTDYDAWHDSEDAVTVDAILSMLRKNVSLAQRVLRELDDWPNPADSPASSALSGAIITDPSFIPAPVRERFGPLLAKYLPAGAP